MYQYLILFLLKDTHVRISTPQKESPTLPTNYLPTKRFSERVISVLKGRLFKDVICLPKGFWNVLFSC